MTDEYMAVDGGDEKAPRLASLFWPWQYALTLVRAVPIFLYRVGPSWTPALRMPLFRQLLVSYMPLAPGRRAAAPVLASKS